jgi:hypothetical protein
LSTTSLFNSSAFRAALLCGLLSACGGGGDAPAGPADPGPPVVVPDPVPKPAPSAYLVRPEKVEMCRSDSNDLLVGCEDAGVSGFNGMTGMAIAGSHAFISTTDSIIRCSIGANGPLSDCAVVGPAGFPRGLTVHASNLYIADLEVPVIRKCEIESDGSLGACTDAEFPDTLQDQAEDIRISNSTAYVLHRNSWQVSKCDVLADGSLSACVDANATGLEVPTGLAISGAHLYVSNGQGGNVTRCVIDVDGGLLTDCVDAGVPGLHSPSQVAIRGSTVYISDFDPAGTVTRCTATTDGLLTGCTASSGPLEAISIVLK